MTDDKITHLYFGSPSELIAAINTLAEEARVNGDLAMPLSIMPGLCSLREHTMEDGRRIAAIVILQPRA